MRSLVRVMQPVVTHLTDSMVTQSQDLQRVVGTVQTVAGQVHRINAAVTSLVDSQQAAQSQTDRLVAVSLQQAELIARLSNLALAGQPHLIIKCRFLVSRGKRYRQLRRWKVRQSRIIIEG